MHAGEHARTHQESAEQRQRERGNRQQQRPAAEVAALFGRRLRVQQRRAGQPGHEAGILDRIPEPPAAPAQLVVCPPRAKCDAQGEEGPGDIGPRPRPANPADIELAVEQCRHRKSECHRESDIAHVEHGRMENQARVLQQRIEIAAFRHRRQQAIERVGGEQGERHEADRDQAHHAEHASHHGQRKAAAETCYGSSPAGQDQHPQQQGTLVPAPDRRKPVMHRQQRVGIIGDVGNREVLCHERPGQHSESDRDQHELHPGCRTGDAHQRLVSALGADQRQRTERNRRQQSQNKRDLANFRKHAHCAATGLVGGCGHPLPAGLLIAWAMASATSLGM